MTGESEAGRDKDDMRWDEAENEVAEVPFKESFIDSIREANDITNYRGLRDSKSLPFSGTEKLVYDAGWGFIRAGFAILTAFPDKVNSRKMNFVGKVVTNNFVSAFYKVRDYVHAHVDAEGLYPYLFEQHMHEGDYEAKRWTIFDQQRRRVYDNKKKDGYFEASSMSRDYITLLYYLRTLDLKVGDRFTLNCFFHGKDWPVDFRVLKREKVEVPAGEFECLKIEPKMVGDGRGLTKRDKVYVWISDDEHRLPVKLKTKVKIGWVSAHLLLHKPGS